MTLQTTTLYHPGRLFVERHGFLRNDTDVIRYANSLRREAGLGDQPPIDLDQIHRRFNMPAPQFFPLPGQQGVLLDGNACRILINSGDPTTRQRFTQAHELMEVLFHAYMEQPEWEEWKKRFGYKKERLCEQGAAALIMPASSFDRWVQQEGVSIYSASRIAELYHTSLMATLYQMVERGSGAHVLVVWRCMLKPTQERVLQPKDQQGTLFDLPEPCVEKCLRVWWSRATQGLRDNILFQYKSIPDESLIGQAYSTGQLQRGVELIDCGKQKIECFVEAKAVMIGEERCVVSILHLLDDACMQRVEC